MMKNNYFDFFKNIKNVILCFIVVWSIVSFKPREINWIAIGDSITYLNDHPEETGNRVTKGYLTGVTGNFSNLHYINKGYNGWTSGGIAQHIDSLGLQKADIYTVFLGTNDWWQGRPIGSLNDYKAHKGNTSFYGSFRIIISKIRDLNPQAKIVLITPVQRLDFVYVNDFRNNAYGSYKPKNGQFLEQFANAVDSIGAYEDIPVVDLYHNPSLPLKELVNFKRLKDPKSGLYVNYEYPEGAGIPFNPLTDDYPYPKEATNLTFDGLHPSDKGNAIIANAITNTFRQTDAQLAYRDEIETTKTGSDSWNDYIDIKQYSKPFWQADTITDETVAVIKENNTASAHLLFKAEKILSIKASNYSRFFEKGKDWDYRNGKLIFGINSSVPFFHNGDFLFNNPKPGYAMDGKVPGTFVLYREGNYFPSMQISVTYIKAKKQIWRGPTPEFAGKNLPNTISMLKKHKKTKIVFYGNSIEAGYSASSLAKAAPYMPTWPDLVMYNLKLKYGASVLYANKSVAGRLAQWGQDSVSTRVISEVPDLVIIGFGMNDGTMKVTPDRYRNQIKSIMDSVSIHNPNAEFILISPMLANPLSSFSGLQSSYKQELEKLKRKGVVVADMTGVHEELLKYKTYQDMTGNNLNHPNDYLARWYAQFICGLLIK